MKETYMYSIQSFLLFKSLCKEELLNAAFAIFLNIAGHIELLFASSKIHEAHLVIFMVRKG